MEENRPKFTAGTFGIIFDDKKRVLLVHRRDYDLWNLPGGRMESGEAPWDGAIREVKEKTGLDVEIIKLSGLYNKSDKADFAFSFLCKIIGGQITLNDEADKIKYFEIDKLPHNTVPKQVERIKDASLNLPGAILKTQTGKSAIELIKEGKLQNA